MLKSQYFSVNGQEYYIEQQLSLSDLLNYFNYNTSLFVLEYNNFICTKDKWICTFIKDNDKIEIITIVGGG